MKKNETINSRLYDLSNNHEVGKGSISELPEDVLKLLLKYSSFTDVQNISVNSLQKLVKILVDMIKNSGFYLSNIKKDDKHWVEIIYNNEEPGSERVEILENGRLIAKIYSIIDDEDNSHYWDIEGKNKILNKLPKREIRLYSSKQPTDDN
jgi:hypothetical protein